VCEALAAAISRRDSGALAALLDPAFQLRTPGAAPTSADAFLAGIRAIPGEILFVRLEQVEIDVSGEGALATGVQHAQVRVEAQTIDDRKPFVDWFVKDASGAWKLRVALDLPELG
jgi:ketosteroid isomerase-like protein